MALDPRGVPGLAWHENGQSALSGPLLAAMQRLDRRFAAWAKAGGAVEYRFPTFIAARELARLDYFRSFPHLVTFPVVLDDDPERLEAFASAQALDDTGAVRLGAQAPVRDVLTPAACYHFYVAFQQEALPGPRTVTTVATCFRREAWYRPLERQWSFTMREIVALGDAGEVQGVLGFYRERLTELFTGIGLPVEWKQATDPFFNPSRNPKFLAQRLDPVKTEMVFGDALAIGSINVHRNFFGETFGITRAGQPAFSGCVAFGLERWLFALIAQFGPDPRRWPAALMEDE